MRTNLTIICVLTLFLSLNAQKVSETKRSMSLGTQPGIIVEVEDADKKLIKKVFDDYAKKYGKLKRNKKADEYFIESAEISSVNGGQPLDVYLIIEDEQMCIFYSTVDGMLSNESAPTKFSNAMGDMTNFSYELKRAVIQEELDEHEKTLKSLDKDLEKLVKDSLNYRDNIEKAKEEITKNEKAIEDNIKDRQDKKGEIEAHKEVMEKTRKAFDAVGK